MSDPLYAKELLKLAADASAAGELPEPRLEGSAHNPVCGDSVSVTLQLDHHGRIAAMAHRTKACVLTQASAAILGARLQSLNEKDVRALRHQVETMLGGGKPPPRPFADYAALAGAASYANRHICVLLPLDAVLGALAISTPSEITDPGRKTAQQKPRIVGARAARNHQRRGRAAKP